MAVSVGFLGGLVDFFQWLGFGEDDLSIPMDPHTEPNLRR